MCVGQIKKHFRLHLVKDENVLSRSGSFFESAEIDWTGGDVRLVVTDRYLIAALCVTALKQLHTRLMTVSFCCRKGGRVSHDLLTWKYNEPHSYTRARYSTTWPETFCSPEAAERVCQQCPLLLLGHSLLMLI